MAKMTDLSNTFNDAQERWDTTKQSVNNSIDAMLEQGTSVDEETLLIMKELLEICRPTTMSDYMEEE